ncbi:Equilibrative nucleotide transporter 5 [Camellia lanceoleosa]|uniref:Equilibrative nucleotide transporter 5 n=1 Tax=Camellia lanceoleosa TaxID=1840588 RepID=A0ACC0GI41_9ERIC|nr:Equilibrative nucleotide transporter 5 [Camellia lanceoleosa]
MPDNHFRYALVLIAMYNVWNLMSRYIPLWESVKIKSRKGLMIATLSRFLLIPAFYFTAKYGGAGQMIMLTSFLGLTSGYLTVCVFTEAPKESTGRTTSTAAEFAALEEALRWYLKMGGTMYGSKAIP